MNSNFNVSFYDQYDNLLITLETATDAQVVGTYLICGDANGNSIKFFVNEITLIQGPSFSQVYTPIPAGFYQQDQAYFNRLSEIYNYVNTNIVSVVIRYIDALKFADGTTQTTAATGGGGGGTVTSVGFTAGTGITLGGDNPITTSGSVTITNSAPDRTVVLNNGTGISTSGTYPNFTITNTSPDRTVVLNNGTGITTSGTYPNFTITNSSPDQTVVLNNGTGISTSGTYPNFTITNTAPDQTVTLTEGAGIDITGTYPNFTIASTVTGGIPHGTASGTDTYTVSISGVTSYADGDAYLIRFTNGNTTGCTLNINSSGAIDLYRNNDGLLIGGDITDGAEMLCVYNSTINGFQVIGISPNSLFAYVTNAEATTITKGQPVYAFGGQGDRLKVKLAYNTGDSTSAQTVGLVLSTSIGANQKGLIIVNGQLDGLNLFPTSGGWADGDPVYLGDTAGTVTKVKPHAPNHLVYLGFVTTASNGSAGRMYVRVQNGYEMDELHDVSAQTPSNNDGLFFNTSTSLWESKSIATALGYTPGTVTSIATTSPILGGPITNTGTISIQQADSSKGGYLSSTDWNTFNNKQNQLNGTGFVKASGTTISYDNTSYYPASNPANFGAGTVTSVAALTLGTSGTDLGSSVANGTTTPVITLNVPDASASARGVITTGTQTIAGAKTFSSNVSMSNGTTITPPTGSGSNQVGVIVSGSNTNGGTNFVDFLKATNTAVGATNINKYFRLNSTGGLEIVNSAYSAVIMTLTDAGLLNGASATEMGYLSGVTSNIQTQLNTKVSNSVSTFGFQLANTIAASTTTWVGIGVTAGSLESNSVYIMPMACTLSDMYIMHYNTTQPATGGQVFTVRKNAVDTALSITIAAGSAATTTPYSNTANSVSFAVGDKLSIRRQNFASGIGGAVNGISFKLTV